MAKKIIDYISPSQVGQFHFCPVSYKYCYVDGKKEQDSNIYLVYGTALHEALAFNYKQKINSKIDLPATEVFDYFKKVFQREYAKLNIMATANKSAIEFKTMLHIAEDVLETYMRQIAPTIKPLEVELDFEIQLINYPIKIKGIIDLVTEDGLIIDHKTAGKSTKRNWTQKTVDESFQLTWYAAGYRKIFKKKESGVQIDVIPREMNPGFLRFKSHRTDTQLHQALTIASTIEKIVDLGVFMPNLQNCNICPFSTDCSKLPLII